ncbi:ribonuclease Z [Robiginitalea sp. IMCC43444]|uniref:ribonuclease Z n=1 Tax=Robiginitalea sp. IMCC43444 TaxID=3459121 RepID=UPI004042D508
MVFNNEGNTTIVLQEKVSLKVFIENLLSAYPKLKNDHLIINLFSFNSLKTGDILEFLDLSNTHRASGKSFVLVTDAISYDEVPDEICVVPSIQEARDMIEMEEIERDLDL